MKKSELDVNQYLVRTDLAVETKEAMANQQAVPAKRDKRFYRKRTRSWRNKNPHC